MTTDNDDGPFAPGFRLADHIENKKEASQTRHIKKTINLLESESESGSESESKESEANWSHGEEEKESEEEGSKDISDANSEENDEASDDSGVYDSMDDR